MNILYLGTGASEGIPSLYCKCVVCENARKKKGKELRTRSGFVLDGVLAIDFSADSYINLVKNNVDFGVIENILITHTHEDHYCPYDLAQRYLLRPDGIANKLNIYGNNYVKKVFLALDCWTETVMKFVTLNTLKKNETVLIDKYTVTPFYSEHMRREDCFVYLIQKDGKNYLHLLDSSEPSEELYSYLVENRVVLNAVTMDCTFASCRTEYYGHMNIWQNIRVKERLIKLGAATDSTKFVCTHISHYSLKDTHESLSVLANQNGLILAYDGMSLDF